MLLLQLAEESVFNYSNLNVTLKTLFCNRRVLFRAFPFRNPVASAGRGGGPHRLAAALDLELHMIGTGDLTRETLRPTLRGARPSC
jgi:hypothetical protein